MQLQFAVQRTVLLSIPLVVMMGNGFVIPLLQELANAYEVTPFVTSAFVSIYPVMQVVFGPICGRASDRYGEKSVLLVALCLSVIAYLIIAMSSSLSWLFAGRILAGMTAGSMPVVHAYLSVRTSGAGRASAMGLSWMTASLGLMLGYLLGGVIESHAAGSSFFDAHGGILVVLLVLVAVASCLTLEHARRPAPRTRPSSGTVALSGKTARLVVSFFGYFLAAVIYVQFVVLAPHWLHSSAGWAAKDVGFLLAGCGAIGVLVQGAVAPKLTQRCPEKWIYAVGFFALGIGVTLVGEAGQLALAPVVGAIVLSIAYGTLMPVLLTGISSFASARGQGSTLGWASTLNCAGAVLGPLVGGHLLGTINPTSYFLAIAALSIAGALLHLVAFSASPRFPEVN